MIEEVNTIIKKLDNTDEVKRLNQLNKILNNNSEYLSLMNDFINNKDSYIENGKYNEEVLNLRKKLFSINELTEYLRLQNNLRLLSAQINNIILSIIE